MKKTLCLVLGLSAVFQPAALPGEGAVRLNLNETLKAASSSNIRMILADEKIQQAYARVGSSASELLPQAWASASQSRQTRNLLSVGIPTASRDPVVGPFNSFDARLSVQQALFDWSAFERLRAARAAKKLSEAERVKTREDVMALAASLYFEAKRARERVRFASAMLANRERLREVSSEGARSGAGTALEARRASDAVLEARESLESARVSAAAKRRDLLVALSMDPAASVIFPVREPAGLWEGFNFSSYPARENHPEVRRLDAVVEDMKAEKRAIAAEFLPRVTGLADYGPSGTAPSDWEAVYTLGAKVEWPILEGGRKLFNLKQARSLLRQAEAERKDALLTVDAALQTALDQLKEASFLAEVRESRYRTARREWTFALKKYKNGMAPSSERYQAYSAYLEAADQRSESEALLQLALVRTAHAMGRISEWFSREDA